MALYRAETYRVEDSVGFMITRLRAALFATVDRREDGRAKARDLEPHAVLDAIGFRAVEPHPRPRLTAEAANCLPRQPMSSGTVSAGRAAGVAGCPGAAAVA